MKIEYTPNDRYTDFTMQIKNCTNQAHVNTYLMNTGKARLLALQVMRDAGLLPDVHLQLAKLRREWHELEYAVTKLCRFACADYGSYWEQYKAAKLRRSDVIQRAETIYNNMFFDPRWKQQKEKAA
jgi:hypothetical protein